MELNDWLAIIGGFGGLKAVRWGEPQDECTEGGCVRRFDGG